MKMNELGVRYALKLRQFPEHPVYSYTFSQELFSLFERTAHRYKPFCSRIEYLIAQSGLPIRKITRVDTMSTPPWRSAMYRSISPSQMSKKEICSH